MIKCSVCGHDWIEGRAVEINRDLPALPQSNIELALESDQEIRRLVNATREAQEHFAIKRKGRRAAAFAWASLAILATCPIALALAFPETTVRAVPASVAVYKALGEDVNIYGLVIRNVEMQHLLDSGKRVIAVKGEVTNVSASSRKIPWLRFGLKDAQKAEVYSWQLDTATRPLNPGESTSFVTRIASPPELAEEIEIRFARLDEIGSSAVHD